MARGNVHFQQHAWGYFTFKLLLPCNDDRSLPLVEKICDSLGFRAANRLRVDKVRLPAVFWCCLEASDRGQRITAKKPDYIDEFTPKTQEYIKGKSSLCIL